MKKILLATSLLVAVVVSAQTGNYYVALKGGLSLRDKGDVSGKVIDKIPYGTRVTIIPEDLETKGINTEGLSGFWWKVKYNNKTGYIVSSYLFPWAPPKTTVKDMKSYIAQSTLPFGAKLSVKGPPLQNVESGGWEIIKQLYKNGAEWHQFRGYEYGSDTWFLPDFDMQQGFVLLRLIPEFSGVFGEKDLFPTESKKIKKGENEYIITVEKEDLGEGFAKLVKRIKIEWADGALYFFEMYQIDNQLVVFLGSGV
jgi:hypothetical protein